MIKKILMKMNSEARGGYLFILPNFIGFLVFTSLPVVASLVLSFCKWDLFTPLPKFVGLSNFIKLFGFHFKDGFVFQSLWYYFSFWRYLIPNDPEFWYFLYNTVFFMIGIPLSMAGSLFLALVMNRKLRGITFFRTIFFLPTISSVVAICLLWRWIYNTNYGLFNVLLSKIGLPGLPWLNSVLLAKPALILMGLWICIGGFNMLLYLAALQGIPQYLFEAADIDGANAWQKFRHIILPMISPTTFFIFIMSVISGFQGGFQNAYLMTRGGPAGSTTTLEYYIYSNAFTWHHMGYASAISWFLFVIIFGVTMLNWQYGGKKVHY